MEKEKQIRNIIHLHIKKTDEDFYFGNLKAMYDNVDEGIIGVKYSYLRNYKFSEKPYESLTVVIKKAAIITSKRIVKETNQE